jgi:hypothetical protein
MTQHRGPSGPAPPSLTSSAARLCATRRNRIPGARRARERDTDPAASSLHGSGVEHGRGQVCLGRPQVTPRMTSDPHRRLRPRRDGPAAPAARRRPQPGFSISVQRPTSARVARYFQNREATRCGRTAAVPRHPAIRDSSEPDGRGAFCTGIRSATPIPTVKRTGGTVAAYVPGSGIETLTYDTDLTIG